MAKEIKHTFYFTQTPEEVWAYLTQPELMEQWLMPIDFKPVVGHHFRFNNPGGTFTVCEVTEVKPFTHLSYIWKNDWAVTKMPYSSTVHWTLTAIEGGTELLLLHNGFELFKDLAAHNGGWMMLTNRLVELLKIKKQIKQTWFFNAAPEVVWNYLTKPELLEQWFTKTDMEAVPGKKFSFQDKTGKTVACDVRDVKPFEKFSYRWLYYSAADGKPYESMVVWTLVPKNKGTELVLVHTGIGAQPDIDAHTAGWTRLGERLTENVEKLKV